ncbi:MAG: hypothetical protein ACR2M9_01120 [Cyanophyceae cyanobacterium]
MATPFQNKMKRQQRRNERLMRKAARVSSRKSGESMGGIDYELPKVQKVLGKINKAKTISYNDVDPRIEEQGKRHDSGINYGSPLNGAYASGAGGMQYVSTAGAFQRLQDDISAGIQADLANRKAKAAAEAKAAKKAEKKQKDFKKATEKFKNKDYSLDVPKFEVTSISEFDKKNNDNLFYQ